MNRRAWGLVKTFLGCLGLLGGPLSHAGQAEPPPATAGTVASVAFMGDIGSGPIWMDLNVPSGDGAVTGTYFYLKHGKELRLSGTKKDSTLLLEERYNGKVTGTLRITYPDSGGWLVRFARLDRLQIRGTWNKPGKKAATPLLATQSDPAYKACAKINIDQLSMADGKSFGQTLEQRPWANTDDGDGQSDTSVSRDFEITHCANGLFGASYEYSYLWGGRMDPETPTAYQTFDLSTMQELTLAGEIAPDQAASFDRYVKKRFVGKGEPHSDLAFYVDDGTVMIGYPEVVDPEAGAGNHTTEAFVDVPRSVLKKYLRKDSALLRLAPKAR